MPELRFDETLEHRSLELRWLELEDSRCPTGVSCIWAGQIVVTIELKRGDERSIELELVLRDGAPSAARQVLGHELALHTNAEIEVSEHTGGGFQVRWRTQDGESGEDRFERILVAAGRRPNLDLALERTGLELDRRGLPRFDPRTMQADAAPIFLAGDVTGERSLLHEAADEGRIAGYNAARLSDIRAHRRRTPLSIVFSDPQIALVGARFVDLEPPQVEIGQVGYDDQGRARVMGKNAGLVRVYAERASGKLVGAEMFGPRVEHTAHLLAWVVQEGLTVERALELPFYHPVIEEGIRTALRDLAARLKLAEKPCARDLDCGPGS